jgi:hypothetical protein
MQAANAAHRSGFERRSDWKKWGSGMLVLIL